MRGFKLFIYIIIIAGFAYQLFLMNNTLQRIEHKLDRMDATTIRVLEIQPKHFGKCSFIRNDDVGIGYDGYLYSKISRKNKQ